MVAVEKGAGTVVLADGVDRLQAARGPQVRVPDVVADGARFLRPRGEEVPEEGVGVGADHPLGQVRRLGEQVEVEGEHPADAGQRGPHVDRGDHVEDPEMVDHLGMVQGSAEGD